MPTSFTGQLNPNEIFGAIYNMIISQEVFGDNIKGTYSSLAEKSKVDGTLYGDQKLYYATDVLASAPWGDDAEAANLLQLHRPKDPEIQTIMLNKFRQISLTVDNYLTKRAWMGEGSFSSFNSIMKGWISDTKKVYESTLFNTFIGTTETNVGRQTITIVPVPGQNDALTMAEALATLLVELKDVSRDFNDYEYLRSYDESDLRVVWNAKHYNTLKKIDMPVIFHKEGLLNEFDQEVLPARYFGTVLTTAGTSNGTQRTLVEGDFGGKHIFPGDLIPNGAAYLANEAYDEDGSIAFKLIHKRSVPFMSAFEVATSFFNPKSLTENHYLTWGYNDLDYLANYPFITARF